MLSIWGSSRKGAGRYHQGKTCSPMSPAFSGTVSSELSQLRYSFIRIFMTQLLCPRHPALATGVGRSSLPPCGPQSSGGGNSRQIRKHVVCSLETWSREGTIGVWGGGIGGETPSVESGQDGNGSLLLAAGQAGCNTH